MLSAGLKSLGGNTLGKLATKLMGSASHLDDEKDLEEETYGQPETEETQQFEVSVEKQDKTESQFDTDAKEELEVEEIPEEEEEDEDSKDAEEEEEVEQTPELSNEEELVNSALFAKEFASAIDHVSEIAKSHREEMIQSAKKQLEESGTMVTDEMMSKAMKTFAVLEAEEVVEESESEEEEVDEEELSKEMEEALEAVRELAQMHKPEFVEKICDLYEGLNEEEPTTAELYDIFAGIQIKLAEEAIEMDSDIDDEDEEDADILAEEMEIALEQVRKQAQLDQEGLVDYICDYYVDFNGVEPSVDTISDIFSRIKEQLAADAREEFLEENEDGDEEDDSDYAVSDDSAAEHYESDEEDDVYVEGEDDAETESEIESEIDDDEAFDYLEEIEDEEELVNDPVFGAMWCSAIEHIQSIAKEEGVDMLWQIVEEYEGETGQQVTEDMVAVAMTVASNLDVVDSEDEETEDIEDLEMAMTEAVEIASALGSLHQQQFVNEICDLYAEENGEEPSLNKLYAIFGDVEDALAESEEEDDEEDEGDIDAETFAEEWSAAMDHIQSVAKLDQTEMVNVICNMYSEATGEEPSTPELYELFANIKKSFAKEATDEVIAAELDDLVDDSEDEDYTVDSDPFYYGYDALDDVLYNDSAYEETDSADSDYEPQFELSAMLYEQDAEEDLAESTEEEVAEEEEEEKAGEVDSDSDSEYSPDKDSYFYMSDYQDEFASDSSSDADSDTESESDDDEDADYDPMNDLFNYPLDLDFDQSDDDSEDEDYSVEKDEYDYSRDVMDDFNDETEEESNGSAAESDLDSELAA